VDDPIGGPLDGAREAWSLRLVAAGADSTPSPVVPPPTGSVVYGPVDALDDRPVPSPRRALPDEPGPDTDGRDQAQ
jgi:hypothetical protein